MTRERAGRGMTYEPWPCCGQEPETSGWRRGRPKNEICDECRHLIGVGKQALERAGQNGRKSYLWTCIKHGWAQYYGSYQFQSEHDTGFDVGRRLADAMFELVESLWSVREKRAHGYIPPGSSVGPVIECSKQHRQPIEQGAVIVHMEQRVRDRVNELDAAIRTALESAYSEGRKRGRSTLLSMAAGDLSLSDFDEGRDR